MNPFMPANAVYKCTLGYSIIVIMGLLLSSLSTQAIADTKTSSSKTAQIASKKLNEVESTEIIIDSVIASVDGVPITLREFSEKLEPKRNVNLADFSQDTSLSQVLDAMIMERLVEAEASARKLKVSPDDIEHYIAQVAAQNNLTKEEFEHALSQQSKSLEEFRVQARLEILRSRLMGQIAQTSPAVTDDELGESSEEEKEQQSEAVQKVRFHLREIALLKQQGKEEDLLLKSEQVSDRLKAGEDFLVVARELSQGGTAQSGGDLGELAEEDLSEPIRDGVADLSPGEHTEAIDMNDAIRFFMLVKKFDEGEASESNNQQREELRKRLETHKLEKRFEEFFTIELPKLHKVDRKV